MGSKGLSAKALRAPKGSLLALAGVLCFAVPARSSIPQGPASLPKAPANAFNDQNGAKDKRTEAISPKQAKQARLTVNKEGANGREPILAALCYHRFGAETKLDPYRISPQRLAGELAWLRRDGWKSVSLSQVAAALDGDIRALPPKGVLLSVDDGYKAGARGAPVFEKYGFRAVYFIVPAMLGHGAFLSWKDLRALEARGHEIACHTLTHQDLAKVPAGVTPGAYVRWVDRELTESKRLLEKGLGHPVVALAWPYGAYNPAVAAAALRVGYRQLWTVSDGVNPGRHLNRMRLRRIVLVGCPALGTFERRMRSRPLQAPVDCLTEGDLIYRSRLPLSVSVPSGVRVALDGKPLALGPAGGLTLGTDLPDGFHFLNFAEEGGTRIHETPFLFQIAPDAWKPYFDALAAGLPPAKAPEPAPVGGGGAGPGPRTSKNPNEL